MYDYFRPKEKYQVWKVVRYHYHHPQALLDIRFSDSEEYCGVLDTACDSENSCDLDIEMDDPRYSEFSQVVFEITEIIKDGPHRYNEFLTIDYRDPPILITNVKADGVIYSAETDPLRK